MNGAPLAQLVRVPVCQTGRQGFKSPRGHQKLGRSPIKTTAPAELSLVKESNSTTRGIEFTNIKGFPKKQGKSKIRRYFRLIRKEIYPHLQFNLRHNAKYSTDDFLDLVTHTALNHDFTNNGSKTYGFVNGSSPHGNTVLHHVRKHKATDYLKMFNKANEKILRIAKNRGLLRGRVDVAIDYTDHLYYGDINTPMVVGTKPQRGTQYAYKYATINVVEKGIRFTLLAIPKTQFVTDKQIVKTLIDYAGMKVDIGTVYIDRAFFTKDVIRFFNTRGLKFLMPAVMNKRIARITKKVKAPAIIDFKMGIVKYRRTSDKYKEPVDLKLVVAEDERDKRVFATNLDVTEGHANKMFELYRKRWGIETSYRMKNIFRTRTTSKNYQVRLFFFLFSVCLYNLWVLVNAFVEAFVFGKALKKPYLTAKIFGAILISTSFYIEDGG